MYTFQYRINEREYNIFMVLEDDNLDRMKEYDPAQFDLSTINPKISQGKKLASVIVGYVAPRDVQQMLKLVADEQPEELMRFLKRGWKWRPECGDYDGPPLSVRTEAETKQ